LTIEEGRRGAYIADDVPLLLDDGVLGRAVWVEDGCCQGVVEGGKVGVVPKDGLVHGGDHDEREEKGIGGVWWWFGSR
jgi:hypothetical protein